MIRDCPGLRGKIAEARSRDSNNTVLHKKFTGGSVTLSAANSPAGLAMRSVRFWKRKIVLCSTPTVKGTSRIEAACALAE